MKQIDDSLRRELTKNIVFMTDETWPEYTSQDKITILHFLSSVDLVSREQIPMIREFAAKHGEKYTVGVLDAGLCPNACSSCQVRALPSMAILRSNVLLAMYQGKITGDGHDHGCGGDCGHGEGFDTAEFLMQLNAWQQMDLKRRIN